jgi:hypothetical protein
MCNRRKTLVLLCCLILAYSGIAKAQQKNAAFDGLIIYDGPALEKCITNLKSRGVSQFLIYQPSWERLHLNIRDSVAVSGPTFLAWTANKKAYARIIKGDTIYEPIECGMQIFEFPDKYKCGVITSECNVAFVPPVFVPTTTDFIAYNDLKSTFYFEGGKLARTYTGTKERDYYRKKWLSIMQANLLPLLEKSKVEKHYSIVASSSLDKYRPSLFKAKKPK